MTLTDMIDLAHRFKALSGTTDPIELREAVDEWGYGAPSDVTLILDGAEYRFIHSDDVDEIMQDELSNDEYTLGCFNACFIADILDVDEELIEAAQSSGKFDAVGRSVINAGKLKNLQKEYARLDGYGHHFNHYDGSETDMGTPCDVLYHVFRLGA